MSRIKRLGMTTALGGRVASMQKALEEAQNQTAAVKAETSGLLQGAKDTVLQASHLAASCFIRKVIMTLVEGSVGLLWYANVLKKNHKSDLDVQRKQTKFRNVGHSSEI